MESEQEPADRRTRTVCLLILTVLAVGVALALLRPVLVPFSLALLLAYCLTPLVDLQVKHLHLPRGPALVGAGLAGLLVVAVLGYLAAASLGQIAVNFDAYRDRLARLTEEVAHALPLDRLGIHRRAEAEPVFTITESTGRQILAALLSALSDLISTGALVLIFMLFLLLGRQGLPHDPTSLLGEVERRVRNYLARLVGLSALTGLLVGLALAALRVEFALVFGFLTFLLNFIPNVGAIIAALLPVPVILLSPHLSPAEQVLAVALPAAIQFVIGSLIQPRVFGGALDLHPVTVLLALIFFGTIWGILGAFLAMPITGVIRIVLGRHPATRPLADLMAGDLGALTRPAPPPGVPGDGAP